VITLLAGLSLVAFAGCAATNAARIKARINEKPAVFAKLTRQQQKDVKWGYIRKGFTPDMVYFALGKPDQIISSSDKNSFVWIYVDRKSINQDLAQANAMIAGSQASSISVPGTSPGSGRTTVIGGHDDNFQARGATTKTLFYTPPQNRSEVYGTIEAARDLPTTWVAIRDNVVVNVRYIDTHASSGKTGSLGG
jgi:hypothetical protein